MRRTKPATERPTAACSRCGGTGKVDLSDAYAETLAVLRGQAAEVSGADMARLMGTTTMAMDNRLVRLEELGLVAGRRDGRRRLWAANR